MDIVKWTVLGKSLQWPWAEMVWRGPSSVVKDRKVGAMAVRSGEEMMRDGSNEKNRARGK